MLIGVENVLVKQFFNFIPETFQLPLYVSYFFNFFIFFQYFKTENFNLFFLYIKHISRHFQLLSIPYYYY